MGSVKDILNRTDFKGGQLMVATYHPDSEEYSWTPLEQALNKHYLKVFMDLIGDDYPKDYPYDDPEAIDYFNILKDRQRQQAKKLLGESDE